MYASISASCLQTHAQGQEVHIQIWSQAQATFRRAPPHIQNCPYSHTCGPPKAVQPSKTNCLKISGKPTVAYSLRPASTLLALPFALASTVGGTGAPGALPTITCATCVAPGRDVERDGPRRQQRITRADTEKQQRMDLRLIARWHHRGHHAHCGKLLRWLKHADRHCCLPAVRNHVTVPVSWWKHERVRCQRVCDVHGPGDASGRVHVVTDAMQNVQWSSCAL